MYRVVDSLRCQAIDFHILIVTNCVYNMHYEATSTKTYCICHGIFYGCCDELYYVAGADCISFRFYDRGFDRLACGLAGGILRWLPGGVGGFTCRTEAGAKNYKIKCIRFNDILGFRFLRW